MRGCPLGIGSGERECSGGPIDQDGLILNAGDAGGLVRGGDSHGELGACAVLSIGNGQGDGSRTGLTFNRSDGDGAVSGAAPNCTLALGIKLVLLEVALSVRLEVLPSGSATVTAKAPVVPLVSMVLIAGVLRVGALFTATTLTVKVVEAVSFPSLTVKVTTEVPVELPTGIRLTVRLEPVPLS